MSNRHEEKARKYCRHGISPAGLRHLVASHAIGPKDTTSDVCHRIIKPATAPPGWECIPHLTNAEKRYYQHRYHTAEEDLEPLRQSRAADFTQIMGPRP